MFSSTWAAAAAATVLVVKFAQWAIAGSLIACPSGCTASSGRLIKKRQDDYYYDGDAHFLFHKNAAMKFGRYEDFIAVSWNSSFFPTCSAFRLVRTSVAGDGATTELDTQNGSAYFKIVIGEQVKVSLLCTDQHKWHSRVLEEKLLDLREPVAVDRLQVVQTTTNNDQKAEISLRWKLSEEPKTPHFKVMLSYWQREQSALKNHLDVSAVGTVTLNNLRPSSVYVVSIVNVSEFDIASQTRSVQQTTPPIISSVLEADLVTTNSLTIKYTETDADGSLFDVYELVLQVEGSEKNFTSITSRRDKRRSFHFKNLPSGRRHTCLLYTVFNSVRSSPVTVTFTTYPEKVQQLSVISRLNSVKMFWSVQNYNMSYTHFRITAEIGSDTFTDSTGGDQILINKLQANEWYTFSITAVADQLESETLATTVLTCCSVDSTKLHFDLVDRTTAIVSFGRRLFVDSNGVISRYLIIIAEDDELDGFEKSYGSWNFVRKMKVWPPYVAHVIAGNPFTAGREQSPQYLIGADSCDHLQRYCNGPLKSNVVYKAKIRACTVATVCMETDYTPMNAETSNASVPFIVGLLLLQSVVLQILWPILTTATLCN